MGEKRSMFVFCVLPLACTCTHMISVSICLIRFHCICCCAQHSTLHMMNVLSCVSTVGFPIFSHSVSLLFCSCLFSFQFLSIFQLSVHFFLISLVCRLSFHSLSIFPWMLYQVPLHNLAQELGHFLRKTHSYK